MTLDTSTSRISYTGNGATTAFAYPFKILDDDDISVYKVLIATGVETLQTKTTHYTVDGVGDTGGGNVTFITAPASTYKVIIVRNQPKTQEISYSTFDAFPAESHEEALDRCMMAIQELTEKMNRAILLPVGSTLTNVALPDPVFNGDTYLKLTTTAIEAVEVDTLSGTFADLSADSSPQLGGDLDCNGNDILVTGGSSFVKESTDALKYFGFTPVSTAVNYFDFANAATGNSPTITMAGSDAAVGLNLVMKSTGTFALTGTSSYSGVATFNAGAYFKNGATAGGFFRMYEDSDNGSNYVTMKADDSLASNPTYSWPANPSSTQFMQCSSAGQVSFTPGKVVQVVYYTDTVSAGTSALVPRDATIPQNTEMGNLFTGLTITPTSATNRLIIDIQIAQLTPVGGADYIVVGLFQDSGAGAIQVTETWAESADASVALRLYYTIVAGTTSATTFKAMFAARSGGASTAVRSLSVAAGNDLYSTACSNTCTITEVTV